MGSQDSKATIRLETQGHEQAAQQEKNVAAAQEQNADAAGHKAKAFRDANAVTSETTQGTQAAADATTKHADEIGKLQQELNRVAPGLGGMLESIVSLITLATALSEKNITLSGALAKVTEWTTKAGGAMKLLGAGGAAVGAILYLLSVWERVQKAVEDYTKGVERAATATAKAREELRGQVVEALAESGKASPDRVEQTRRRAERLVQSGYDPNLASSVAASTSDQQIGTDELLRAAAAAQSGQADPSDPRFLSNVRNLSGEQSRIVENQLATTLQESVRDAQRLMEQVRSFDVFAEHFLADDKFRVVDSGTFDPELAKRVLGAESDEEARAKFGRLQAEHVRNRIESRGGDASDFGLPHPDEPATREMVGVLRNIEQLLSFTMANVGASVGATEDLAQAVAGRNADRRARNRTQGSPYGTGVVNGHTLRDHDGRR